MGGGVHVACLLPGAPPHRALAAGGTQSIRRSADCVTCFRCGKMWPPCRSLRNLALALARSQGARACSGDERVSYTQGQSPEPRTREYFYYVDHQGQVCLARAREESEGAASGGEEF